MNATPLQLVPLSTAELEQAFMIYRAALHDVITQAFGWDELFQRDRFRNRYKPEWFHWIESSPQRVGIICFREEPGETHLSLLILLDEYRGRHLGKHAMRTLHERAAVRISKITLSSFRKNLGAIRFYERLGYCVVGGDEHFVDLRITDPASLNRLSDDLSAANSLSYSNG